MNVGVCKVTLRLAENESLKGKRRVIKSLTSRIKTKFNVSVGEVGDNSAWQLATLGISYVSNSSRHTDEVLGKVLAFIEASRDGVEVVECERETLSGF